MATRKTPILLRRGPVSGLVYAIHRYPCPALSCAWQDVTADFDALMLEELLADDAPGLVGILDGVADGCELDDGERAQVRAFRERLRVACERHNARLT